MADQSSDTRKKMFIARILHTVEQYFKAHGEPIQMRILSAKFAKAMQVCGGFPEAMAELEAQGEIRIELTKTGAQLVYPKLAEKGEKVWF